MKNFGYGFVLTFCFTVVAAAFLFSTAAQAADGKAKNVILMIGDGMGFNSDLAGTYYRYGEAKKKRCDSFPVYLGCTTFSRAKKDQPIPADCKGYDPDVFWASIANGNQGTEFTKTTDSAASSTAFNSGTKTLNGSIGVDADQKPVELFSEVAVKHGKKIGTVTTVPLSHATPAGFFAHCKSRSDMDEIFLQQTDANKGLTIVMGGGHPFYVGGNKIKVKENEKEKDTKKRFLAVGGEETWNKLQTGSYNGYTVITDEKQFADLAAGKGNIPDKVIGIGKDTADIPPKDGYLEDLPETETKLNASFKDRNWNELPTLAEMSLAAINVLTKNNDKGFVMLIEGGAIDHANHGQNAARSCFEHTGFTKAIDAVIDWIEKNSSWDETLVVITADHATGQIWGPDSFTDENENGVYDEGDGTSTFNPLKNNGRGKIPDVQYAGKGHSNALVPLWAKGPGSELFLKQIKGNDEKAAEFWNFSGDFVDNTDIAVVIKAALAP
ncbi:MAG: alkaline phosphatase [Planctomycetaceae bacterium]|jgi:alkaline phosphatase|nr:alkaline phosphatase [Planctomycetaceae bacterium]